MSLSAEIAALLGAAHELMYLGMDGSPVYSDDLSRRNSEVYRLTTASFIDHCEKQKHIQEILDRCWNILDVLPASLLKLRLLTACYGEVFDEPLADEGRAIIASWDSASLTSEQQEAIDEFQNVIDNPYPWEELED